MPALRRAAGVATVLGAILALLAACWQVKKPTGYPLPPPDPPHPRPTLTWTPTN